MKEEALVTGTLEPTNEPYAIAKIAGIKLCESYNRQCGHDYRSVMPTNPYGCIPAMLRRFHEAVQASAPEVMIWGTGTPMREFLHVFEALWANEFAPTKPARRDEFIRPMSMRGQPPRGGVG